MSTHQSKYIRTFPFRYCVEIDPWTDHNVYNNKQSVNNLFSRVLRKLIGDFSIFSHATLQSFF